MLQTAAVLGRHFDWRLLPAATGLDTGAVTRALERGVESQLLAADTDAFRFRHVLTREAVAGELLPPRRAAFAGRALAALEAEHPGCQADGATWPPNWPSRLVARTGQAHG